MSEFAFHPEDKARSLIDRQLGACGWLIQSKGEMNLGAGLGVAVREFQTASGPVDYGLFVGRKLCGVIEAKPDFHHAYNALGFALADRNIRLKEARELIVTALEFAPDDPMITDSLGWVEYRMGNKVAALAILESAYKTKNDPEIGAHLGELYWVLGKKDQALKVWREAKKLAPANEILLETLKRLKAKL
jgi:Flp pilus assembly protein TadD